MIPTFKAEGSLRHFVGAPLLRLGENVNTYQESLDREVRDTKNALKSKIAEMNRWHFLDKELAARREEIFRLIDRLEQNARSAGYNDGYLDSMIAFDDGMC